jgi:2,3-bisphosphoglycerate-dependent phosphoglycerate mutase
MPTVYVVTHPEATHHVEHVVGGWHDSQLTPAGEAAAASIGHELRARIPVGATAELFSSDLRRAAKTAQIVGALIDADPIFDPRLREKSYGEAEGKPQAWMDERFEPPPAIGDRMDHEGVRGAETRRQFALRIYDFMDDLLRDHREQQVLITHGFSVTFLVAAWIKMPIESLGYVNFHVTPGSITVLREDDYFHNRRVTALGITSHLNAGR